MEQEEPTAALEFFTRAVESFGPTQQSSPGRIQSLFARARAYLQIGAFTAAYQDFRDASQQLDDGRITACMAYALAKRAAKDKNPAGYQEALAHFKRATEQGFSPAAVYHNIGYCHWKLNELDSAEAAFHQALDRDTQLQTTYHCLAVADLRRAATTSRLPDVQYIETAIHLGPGTAELYADAACIYAWAARHARKHTPVDLKEYVDRTIEYCQRATEMGTDSSPLKKRLLSYDPRLADQPRFRSIPNTHTSDTAPENADGLLDPLLGLGDSLIPDRP